MEELQNLTEDYVAERTSKLCSPGSLKKKGPSYLGKGAREKLSKTDLKRLRAKANKMKKSDKKSVRDRGIQLARQVSFAFNMRD